LAVLTAIPSFKEGLHEIKEPLRRKKEQGLLTPETLGYQAGASKRGGKDRRAILLSRDGGEVRNKSVSSCGHW